jgi:hypothetical protein
MQRQIVALMALLMAGRLWGAESSFNFSDMVSNGVPTNCTSILGGEGKPGNWKVVLDEVPLPIAPLSPKAPSTGTEAVVGQFAWDATDEHFPMLVLGKDTYADFTFTTRFKIVDGLTEQMAGVAFRLQDERNYYYVRASALGNTFYFYTVTKGVRSNPIGNQMTIEKGVWHELKIECEGPGWAGSVAGVDGSDVFGGEDRVLDEVGFDQLFHGRACELYAAGAVRAVDGAGCDEAESAVAGGAGSGDAAEGERGADDREQ